MMGDRSPKAACVWVRCVALHPDPVMHHRVIFSGGSDGILRVWDVRAGACTKRIRAHSGSSISSVCVCILHGRLVGYTASEEGIVKAWDVDSGRLLGTFLGHSGPITCMTAGTTHLFTASWDKTVKVWKHVQSSP
eukprot:TRINITY_DN10372_c0_g2_i1.p1 TRINITY_DN10372_c0_g2~~TRINITY_DN10372_c0_g2_i1.p1  ORF type:complete len:135 (+),score=18.99 TRINITY_DN10372_c0_g2_i1:201-605(+)